jgi:hypothetical protein
MDNSQIVLPETTTPELPRWLRVSGFIIGISYPVLAISTFFRAAYQLFLKEGVTSYVGPMLTAVACICYVLASIGFFVRERWAWRLSMGVLLFEMVMVLLVGFFSLLYPEVIGRTVWGNFGRDYGFFPLIQPLLGLAWLLHTTTRAAYGISHQRQ